VTNGKIVIAEKILEIDKTCKIKRIRSYYKTERRVNCGRKNFCLGANVQCYPGLQNYHEAKPHETLTLELQQVETGMKRNHGSIHFLKHRKHLRNQRQIYKEIRRSEKSFKHLKLKASLIHRENTTPIPSKFL